MLFVGAEILSYKVEEKVADGPIGGMVGTPGWRRRPRGRLVVEAESEAAEVEEGSRGMRGDIPNAVISVTSNVVTISPALVDRIC